MLSESFYFIYPLWLIAIIVVITWFLITRKQALQPPSAIQAITVFYPLLTALNLEKKKIHVQNTRLWISIIFCLLSISLAQPAYKTSVKESNNKQQNVDLILVVNTSVSMVLRDYQETDNNGTLQQFDRMEKTKRVLKKLVNDFKGKRIALVILGRPAAIWLPLTEDRNQVQHSIKKLQTTLGGRSSDIGATLQLVLKQLVLKQLVLKQLVLKQLVLKTAVINNHSTAQKTVLLVNDGYVQIGSISPLQSVAQLSNNNVILHTLAIGSPKQPEFSLGVGHLIYSPVDLKLMQSLANAGKGSMVHAWKNNAVKELLTIINQPIKQAKNSPARFNNNALYFYPLSLAMLIVLLIVFPLNQLFNMKRA